MKHTTKNLLDNTCNTLEEFANLINDSDEWKVEFADIIEENGWEDNTGEPYGICADKGRRLVFNENGIAVVVVEDANY